jgi:hypothetical protein
VLGACGVDTADYTIPDVAGWANGDVSAVRAAGETVTNAARAILDRLGSDNRGDAPEGESSLAATGGMSP